MTDVRLEAGGDRAYCSRRVNSRQNRFFEFGNSDRLSRHRIGLVSNREFRIGFCACTLCLPKKTSSNINDFDCRCSRHSIRPFGRNACCLALTAALTPRTISPVRATHRIEFFPLPVVQVLHCPSERYDSN